MFDDFTLGLVLIDYISVILLGIGLFFIARVIHKGSHSAGQTAFFGALLIVSAGLCKATWKLLIVTTGADHALLKQLLWILMGPGFTLVFAATLQWSLHASHKAPKVLPALMATIVLASSLWAQNAYPQSPTSFYILLGATIIFSSAVSIAFIGHSFKRKLYTPLALLAINLIANLVIQKLAHADDTATTLPLVIAAANAASQLSLALGTWLLYKSHLKE